MNEPCFLTRFHSLSFWTFSIVFFCLIKVMKNYIAFNEYMAPLMHTPRAEFYIRNGKLSVLRKEFFPSIKDCLTKNCFSASTAIVWLFSSRWLKYCGEKMDLHIICSFWWTDCVFNANTFHWIQRCFHWDLFESRHRLSNVLVNFDSFVCICHRV